MNLYTYVENNPLTHIDPTGHFDETLDPYVTSSEDMKDIYIYSKQYSDANGVGTAAEEAHAKADAIRFKYRSSIPTSYWPSNWFARVSPLDLGNKVHYDKLNGATGEELPSGLQRLYPDTEFRFTPRGAAGADVEVVGGLHPSEYAGSEWPEGVDYADFKPDTDSGAKTFKRDIAKGKLPADTFRLTYNTKTGQLNWPFKGDINLGLTKLDVEMGRSKGAGRIRGAVTRFFEWFIP